MNETIISNWNKVVKKDDLVYHLGDFMFGKTDAEFNNVFRRLNGLIVLIRGNHDGLAWKNRSKFYASYNSYHEIKINGQDITLCHYAMRVFNKSHRGAYCLYGHSHGSLPDDPHSLSFDCGVDCHNFTPINFEEVKEIMSKKLWKPIDHHGERHPEGGAG
jgi:calcineurin-like phosphoesterase family protein